MEPKFYLLFVAAFIPLIIGSIWYNPKVFGSAWMNHCGVSKEKLESGNMALIFGLTYIFSVAVAFLLATGVIHQMGVYQVLAEQPDFGKEGSVTMQYFNDFMTRYGDFHRTFGHGALHGALTAFCFALPLVGIPALFERRSWIYILIHFGYWLVVLTVMGGVLCLWM